MFPAPVNVRVLPAAVPPVPPVIFPPIVSRPVVLALLNVVLLAIAVPRTRRY